MFNKPSPDNLDMSPMAIAATTMHELYRTLCNVGFSEAEALQLVATLMATSTRAQ